tara:strand:- start:475 stop:816 length:342 start_codon:yes stop_codon:yes gene_type:complete
MQNKIDIFFNDYQNVSCSFTTEANADSFLTKKGYLTKLMAKSISEVTGQNTEPEFATDGGTSDARFIKDYCEVAELGIINKTLHKIDEFVFLEDIKKLKKIYLQIIENYFKKN